MKAPIQRVATARAPAPAGHYVQATAWGDLVFVSGQLPLRPDGTHMADATVEAQIRRALANLLAVLAEAGSCPDHVLRVTAYLVGVEHWLVFDQIFAELFGPARPARAVLPVPQLHHGYLVEVEAVATRAP
ncbi:MULTISPECIES: RidA family protein [unclassified Methylobacterium]|uniref:RidA family protein n=1 Tax=unclassified Methylobacterium TaxID=2615210 RepID=UPI0022698A09|nr:MULTISPECIES: RidA family protein [unclassified Methylobacterium]